MQNSLNHLPLAAWRRVRRFHTTLNSILEVSDRTWSSLVKEESLACQITSPFNNKLGCFCK